MPVRKPVKKVETKAPAKSPSGGKFERMMAVAGQINKAQGISETAKLRTADTEPPIARISSGILSLDVAIGGGIPRGRMTQFKGPESAFKTSTLFLVAAGLQEDGGTVAWVQGEEMDKKRARDMGCDPERLLIIPAHPSGDEALDRAVELVESGTVDLLVVDSLQGVKTTRETETPIGDTGYGSGAPQMWGQFCGRIARAFSMAARETAVIWTSQMRAKVGKFIPKGGDTDDGTQIWALKHWKSVDVRFRQSGALREEGERPYARTFAFKVEKNKTAPPDGFGEFTYYYRTHDGVGPGIDVGKETAALGLEYGLIAQQGAWYTVGGKRVNGAGALAELFRRDDELRTEVRDAIREAAVQ